MRPDSSFLVPDVTVQPGMNFTASLAGTQSQEEDRLKSQMFKGGLPHGLKWNLSQLVKHQRKVPRGNSSPTLGFVPMKTVQQTDIFANIQPIIAHHICNSSSIAFNGARLKISLLNKCKRKSTIWLTEGDLKSTLWESHHLTNMVHFDLYTALVGVSEELQFLLPLRQ